MKSKWEYLEEHAVHDVAGGLSEVISVALFPESEELQTPIKTHLGSPKHHIIRIT